MAKCTWRNAATAVSDVRIYDDDISVAFFLLGGDKSWTTLIPICSSCELEVGRTSRLPRPGFGTGMAYSL